MKLGYFCNTYPMASQTFIRRELLELERRGVSVRRYALRPWATQVVDPKDARERAETQYVLGEQPSGIPSALSTVSTLVREPLQLAAGLRRTFDMWKGGDRSLPKYLVCLAEACRLKQLTQSDDVEHLHVHFATNAADVAHLCHAMGGPSYSFMVHGPEDLDRAPGLNYPHKVRDAKFVSVISHYARSQVSRWIDPALWSRLHVVRCGLDDQFLRERQPSPVPDRPVFVNIARFSSQKGLGILIDAMAKVVESRPDARLVLVGGGELEDSLRQQVAERGITDAVEFAGWATTEEVVFHLEQSRALVMSSFGEGLPVVLMEALALGRPVISTLISGVPELVQTGKNGWLVFASDIDGLANAMLECLHTSPERLTEMGAWGRRAVENSFCIEGSVSKLLELFGLPALPAPPPAVEAGGTAA
ncbi:MAG: glycosyltransferase family 4 protein [Myxococcota bacterium]